MPRPPTGHLPARLESQLKNFRRKMFFKRAGDSISVCCIAASIVYLVFFLTDRLWDTPQFIAWICFSVICLGLPIFAICRLWHWRFREYQPRQLAQILFRHNRTYGDRLLCAIDLTQNSQVAPELPKAALVQCAQQLENLDFFTLIPRGHSAFLIKLSCFFLFIIACLAVCFPQATLNTWQRWLDPFHPPARFTFTVLTPLSDPLIVPRGEPHTFLITLDATSTYQPNNAQYRLGNESWINVKRTSQSTYRFDLPSMFTPGELEISVGDVNRHIQVIPQERPAMKHAEAIVTLPAYTKRPTSTIPMRQGMIPMLTGSVANIRLSATSPLKHARVSPEHLKPRLDGTTALIPNLVMGNRPIDLKITWTDHHNLRSLSPFHLSLTPQQDQKPRVVLTTSSPNQFLIEGVSIPLEVEVSDDYGIKDIGLSWQLDTTGKPVSTAILKTGSPTTQDMTVSTVFQAPRHQEKGPLRLTIRAYATDYAPGSENTRTTWSSPIIFQILSPEQHAEMIRLSLEKFNGSLEGIVRDLDQVKAQLQRLRQLGAQQLRQAQQKRQLLQLIEQEQQIRKHLEQHVKHGSFIFQEALQNSQIPARTMQQFLTSLTQLSPKVTNLIATARQQLIETTSPIESPLQHLSSAEQTHDQATQIVKAVIASINTNSHTMEAVSIVARLNRFSALEYSVCQSLITLLPSIAAAAPDELSASNQEKLKAVQTYQAHIIQEMNWFMDDLEAFRHRMANPVYSQLYDRLMHLQLSSRMEHISDCIATAHPGIGIEHAYDLSHLFKDCAKMLEHKQAGQSTNEAIPPQQGQKGNNELSPSAFELTLKLMRMLRHQQDILLRTRHIQRQETVQSAISCPILAQEQDELQADVMDIISEQTESQLIALLGQCRHAMNDAIDGLEQGNAGPTTTSAQMEVIELIYQSARFIQGQGNNMSASSAALMNMFHQLLGSNKPQSQAMTSSQAGMGQGKPGQPGSGSSSSDEQLPGPTHPRLPRTVPGSSGVTPETMPEEFRQILDAYNRTLQTP